MSTVADLLLARAEDDRPAVLVGDRSWSYRQLVEEADAVVWRPAQGDPLRPLTDDDRRRLEPLLRTKAGPRAPG